MMIIITLYTLYDNCKMKLHNSDFFKALYVIQFVDEIQLLFLLNWF